ncbi:MAG: P1 family peptidase [Candidatus Hodarchaeales archaeon]|jgi:L-aminopeptidase/D-esterase-like protein
MNNKPLSNDLIDLKPKTNYRDPVLKFDFPGLKIGIGEYEEGPTGCTVFHFAKRVRMTSDFRGGSGPFIINQHAEWIDAICFTGGSLYGHEAITGVNSELLKMQGYKSDWLTVPMVAGAICYDLGWRANTIYPDKKLARATIVSARENIFPLGNQGAGRLATVGKLVISMVEPGGQGAAFLEIGKTKILFFTVVNSLGALIDKSGKVVRGNYDRKNDKRVSGLELLKKHHAINEHSGNTTLNLLVTNQKFNRLELIQIARQVHTSLSRAIDPYHTIDDGDILFAVTTDDVENKDLPVAAFGIAASDIAWDAVLNSFEPDYEPLPKSYSNLLTNKSK